jgi:hypothetical protein
MDSDVELIAAAATVPTTEDIPGSDVELEDSPSESSLAEENSGSLDGEEIESATESKDRPRSGRTRPPTPQPTRIKRTSKPKEARKHSDPTQCSDSDSKDTPVPTTRKRAKNSSGRGRKRAKMDRGPSAKDLPAEESESEAESVDPYPTAGEWINSSIYLS